MNNIEIRFLNDQVYLLKPHHMTSTEFELQISKYQYAEVYEKYKHIKDENGVERSHFPAVNMVFYKEIFENQNVIRPENFFDAYLNVYSDVFSITDNTVEYVGVKYSKDALAGRILRTYPSLIRDFDFYLMLTESGYFQKVVYSCQEDIQGKDIIIRDNGKEFVVSLYVDTGRSNYFKRIKSRFRHNYSSNEIKMPLNLERARKCGDFFLYSKREVITVANAIERKK